MDWSQIYEEDANDPTPSFPSFFPPFGPPPTVASFAENFSGTSDYNSVAAYIFTINYILGVGCLGVPYGFARAGIALGSFIVVLVTAVSYATVCYVAETVRRAEALARMPCERGSRCWLCFRRHGKGGVCGAARGGGGEYGSVAKTPSDDPTLDTTKLIRADTLDSVGGDEDGTDWSLTKSYEVISLCEKFLGGHHVVIYQVGGGAGGGRVELVWGWGWKRIERSLDA